MAFLNYTNSQSGQQTAANLRNILNGAVSHTKKPLNIILPDQQVSNRIVIDPSNLALYPNRNAAVQAVVNQVEHYEIASLLDRKDHGEFELTKGGLQRQRDIDKRAQWDIFEVTPDPADIVDENGEISQQRLDDFRDCLMEWASRWGTRDGYLEGQFTDTGLYADENGVVLDTNPVKPVNNGLRRMGIVQEVHTDAATYHFHIYTHRVPVQFTDQKPILQSAKMGQNSDHTLNRDSLRKILASRGFVNDLTYTQGPNGVVQEVNDRKQAEPLRTRDYNEDVVSRAQVENDKQLKFHQQMADALAAARDGVQQGIQAKAERDKAVMELEDANRVIDKTNDELTTIRKSLHETTETNKSQAETIDKLTGSLTTAQEKIEDQTAEIEELVTANNDLAEENTDLLKENSALTDSNKQLTSENMELKTKLSENEALLSNVSEEAEDLRAQAKRDERTIDNLNESQDEARKRLTEYAERETSLKGELEAASKRESDLRQEVQKAVEELNAMKPYLEELREIRGQSEEMRRQLDALTRENAENKRLRDEAEKVARERDDEISKLNGTIDSLSKNTPAKDDVNYTGVTDADIDRKPEPGNDNDNDNDNDGNDNGNDNDRGPGGNTR